jgi:NADH-quinone oxidoreductase subunit J
MLDSIVFYSLAAFILGFGVLVVTARNTVHSVIFLVANFLCIAVLYVTLAAEFLAVIQVLVYAGGIVVLYLFVVMLVNLKRTPETPVDSRRRSWLGFGVAGALLAEITAILVYSAGTPAPPVPPGAPGATAGNTEAVGRLLYLEYLVPFEVASMLLLVAMIGAIVLARRDPQSPETR